MTRPVIGADLAELLDQCLPVGGWHTGAVAAVTAEGEVVWERRSGVPASQYRIGSITKTFTAALVMRLRDEGALVLEDAVGVHLPDAPYGDATVRALLSHSSGMVAEPAGPWWERSAGVDWAELVRRNADAPQVFAPGLRYHYSNLGFAILGQLVARLRGRPWAECVEAELTGPLGMEGTTSLPLAGAAAGTSLNVETRSQVAEHVVETGAMAPAGQLWSTTGDLARWLDFLAGARPDVLRAETLVEMATVQSGDPEEQHVGGYGLGLRLKWSAHGTLRGHTGSMPGYLAAAFVQPSSRVGAVQLASATTGLFLETNACSMIGEVLEDHWERMDGEVGELQPGPPDDVAGAWYHGNTRYEAVATPGGLTLSIASAASTWRFAEVGPDRYVGLNGYPAGEALTVHRDASGDAHYLEVVTFVLTRTPYDATAPIPGELPTSLD